MAAAAGGGSGGGGGKAAVAEQIAQAVRSTSNLLQRMEQSSPAQVHLAKLLENLLAKASFAKNTEQVLSNTGNTQLRSILPSSQLKKDQKNTKPEELAVEYGQFAEN